MLYVISNEKLVTPKHIDIIKIPKYVLACIINTLPQKTYAFEKKCLLHRKFHAKNIKTTSSILVQRGSQKTEGRARKFTVTRIFVISYMASVKSVISWG